MEEVKHDLQLHFILADVLLDFLPSFCLLCLLLLPHSRKFTILFSLSLQKCIFQLCRFNHLCPNVIRNLLLGASERRRRLFVIGPIVKWRMRPGPMQTAAPLEISPLRDHGWMIIFPTDVFLKGWRTTGSQEERKKKVTIRNANRLKLIKGWRVWFYLTLRYFFVCVVFVIARCHWGTAWDSNVTICKVFSLFFFCIFLWL